MGCQRHNWSLIQSFPSMIWVVLRMDHVFLADLSNVLHKVHETFLALAAQLHEIHEAVKVRMLYVSCA